ncbi:MAG TPA: fructose PTS transporter subunit IIA [Nitrospirota bacterium]|nr:fructose PTS transporter subunit IIA [Nitrospirota bacterium]
MATIKDLLQNDLIIENLAATDKNGVLREFARLLKEKGKIEDEENLVRVLTEREALGSTGIGDGVAIPHGKLGSLSEIIVAFGRSMYGVEYQSLDAKPVFLFFLLVTPDDKPGDHLKTLARISRILKNSALRTSLRQAPGRQEMRILLFEEDSKYPQPVPQK